MNNYIAIIRRNNTDKITKADFLEISDAKFDAITMIVYDDQDFPPPPTPPANRWIKVTYKGKMNIRKSPSASILVQIVGSISEGETRPVSEEATDSSGNIWCKIGNGQWIARIFQNNVKAVYL